MIESLRRGMQTYDGQLAGEGGRMRAAPLHNDALAVVLYESPAYGVTVPALGVARLSINLSQAHVSGNIGGDRSKAYLARRHSLFLTPAGADASWRKASSSRHINIYFQPAEFENPEDRSWSSLFSASTPLLNVRLVGAGPMIDMLATELSDGQPFRSEAVDSLARLLLIRLARQQAARAVPANPVTPALQARLTEYIVDHLDQRLLVPDLAAVSGLPPHRFAQAFASATGLSPHQFVLQLRLKRAVHALRHSSRALADIALLCGFASQQHMTELMRRRLGTTPARQRAKFARDERCLAEG